MKEFIVSKNDIIGGVAKWGVTQSPYHRPQNLETVLDKLDYSIAPMFKTAKLGFLSMNYAEIKDFVSLHTRAIPEFMDWNKRRNGREGAGFSSRDSDTPADDDFIDLDALARNVANEIVFDSMEGRSIPDLTK